MEQLLCEICQKPQALCVCASIPRLATAHHVLILQHPQEPDKELGSARLAHLALSNSTLKIGLSWRNLSTALGREVQNSRWAVLYLGSGTKGVEKPKPGLNFVTKSGEILRHAGDLKKLREDLEGVVVLDGTWSQAKALWWRNPWLLKLRRAVLVPSRKSLYGPLRKEPRGECLSTIESVAEALVDLGEKPEVGEELRNVFLQLLMKYKEFKSAGRAPKPAP